MYMNRKPRWARFVMIAICCFIVGSLFVWGVMNLWNRILVVSVNGIHPIDFWQALGILVLSKILFSGFGGRWGGGSRHRWGREMKEKWEKMTPEEREQFKQQWRNKCRPWGRPEETQAGAE